MADAIETLREFLAAMPTGNIELIYTSALPRVGPACTSLDDLEALVQAAERALARRGMQHKYLPEEIELDDVLRRVKGEAT